MMYGFVLPRGDAQVAVDTAVVAEQSGWDAFFVWEPIWGIDAWVCLTAAAMRTERIRLGTMLTPLSRMRPWKLASETATLDNRPEAGSSWRSGSVRWTPASPSSARPPTAGSGPSCSTKGSTS